MLTTSLTLGLLLVQAAPALAQAPTISDAECQALRQRLGEHAQLSAGVRRLVASQAGPAVAGKPAATAPATGRAEAIRARLQQIPAERQALEEQRLGAMMKFDLSRAGQIQAQMQALDSEKESLEREQATLPAAPAPAAAPAASAATTAADPVARLRCQDLLATLESALKTRRRELGAREEQTGAIPLIAMKGKSSEQIGKELASQFAAGPAGTSELGLYDADGNGQLNGIVDVPAPGLYRFVRQRGDGTLSYELFATTPAGAAAYGEMTRRLEETAARQTGQTLGQLVALRPAGAVRTAMQTAEFGPAYAHYQAGNFAEAARLGTAAARTSEYTNFRGQAVRVLELMSPVSGGVSLKRVVVLSQTKDQDLWEETTTTIRPVSYWKTDVEVARSRLHRTPAGAMVGTPTVSTPAKFSLER
jgi:hypothetical protein